MEPCKPTHWSRPPLGCKKATCKLCQELDSFLRDPLLAEKTFDDPPEHSWSHQGHIYYQVSYTTERAEKVQDEEKKTNRTKVIKTDNVDKKIHQLWKDKYDGVHSKVFQLKGCKGILGGKYDELMDMRVVKLPTDSGKKDMEKQNNKKNKVNPTKMMEIGIIGKKGIRIKRNQKVTDVARLRVLKVMKAFLVSRQVTDIGHEVEQVRNGNRRLEFGGSWMDLVDRQPSSSLPCWAMNAGSDRINTHWYACLSISYTRSRL